MKVEFLKALRHQQLLQLGQRLLQQIRLLAVEHIDIADVAGAQRGVQLLVAQALFLFLLRHIILYYPPFTVMRTVPCWSVRHISAPTASSRWSVCSDGWP